MTDNSKKRAIDALNELNDKIRKEKKTRTVEQFADLLQETIDKIQVVQESPQFMSRIIPYEYRGQRESIKDFVNTVIMENRKYVKNIELVVYSHEKMKTEACLSVTESLIEIVFGPNHGIPIQFMRKGPVSNNDLMKTDAEKAIRQYIIETGASDKMKVVILLENGLWKEESSEWVSRCYIRVHIFFFGDHLREYTFATDGVTIPKPVVDAFFDDCLQTPIGSIIEKMHDFPADNWHYHMCGKSLKTLIHEALVKVFGI